MNMSLSLLRQTMYALEARIKELNNRCPEPETEQITNTSAALKVIKKALKNDQSSPNE